jgi:dihydroorotase
VFDEDGALDRFEAFASLNGPAFYRLPVNADTITLERSDVRVPDEVAGLVPFCEGKTLRWRLC